MALFEFSSQRLVPAQFGHAHQAVPGQAVLEAVRGQILQLLEVQLFPITWHDADGQPWLTAMAPSGQAVCIEVLSHLDGAALVAALGRAGRISQRGWLELAESYPRGAPAFRRDWNAFRESLPPRVEQGPRLHIVAASIEEQVREALTMLEEDVAVHEMAARQMSNGRLFLEFSPLRPPVMTLPWLQPSRRGQVARPGLLPEQGMGAGTPPDGLLDSSTAAVEPDASAVQPDAEQRLDAERPPESSGLLDLARELSSPAQLVWHNPGPEYRATLELDGSLLIEGHGPVSTPEASLAALGHNEGLDAWQVWRFGAQGPSLREALDEISAPAAPPDPMQQAEPRRRRRARRRHGPND